MAAIAVLSYAAFAGLTAFAWSAGILPQFAGNRRWGAHPPCVDNQFRQALLVYFCEPEHHQRPAVVPGRGEEDPRLAEQQRLLLSFVADIQHRDIGTDHPGLPGRPLGIGPDEPLAAHPEVEAVAVDLLHLRQRQRQAAHVVGVGHQGSSPRTSTTWDRLGAVAASSVSR